MMGSDRAKLSRGRVFPLGELDGFYVGNGLCVHVSFEDDETIVIDVYNDERASFNPEVGDLCGCVSVNLRTGVFWSELEGASNG